MAETSDGCETQTPAQTTTARDALWSPWLRVERAQELLEEFGHRRRQWIEAGAYDLELEPDVERMQTVILRLKKSFPEMLYCVVADIVSNLDAAMDQLATLLAVEIAKCDRQILGNCHFPVGENQTKFEKRLRDYKRYLTHATEAFYRDVAPYGGGANEALFSLRQLNNHGKYHVVVNIIPNDNIRVDVCGTRQWFKFAPYQETERVVGCFPLDAELNPRLAVVAGVVMAGTGDVPKQRGEMLGFYLDTVARVLHKAEETFFS